MKLPLENIYKVQKAIWDRFYECVSDGEGGWHAWESFLSDNGLEKESGGLDFQLHLNGRVSILDPSSYGRLWMREEFALKILFLGRLP